MKLEQWILKIVLGILNVLTGWMKPQPNRITFISMTMDHLSGDLALIDQALKKEAKFQIHYDLMQIKKTLWGDFLYFLDLCRQLIEIKKSQLVILNDNNYVVSHYKPRGTKVLQVWHACGAIKKFGNQIERSYEIKGYDAILCSSKYWQAIYAEAFEVSCGQVHVTGMPRIDELMDFQNQEKQKEEFLRKNPICRHKKSILYAPTFRGNIIKCFQVASFDIPKVLDALGDDYVILYKFHPLLPPVSIDHPRAVDCQKEDLYTLMTLSDVLISDYSSVILDYSLLEKPMIAYIDDLEEYEDSIGLNIDYRNEFPGAICTQESDLVQALQNLEKDPRLDAFRQKYMAYADTHNTQRVVSLIHELMKTTD